VGIWKGRTEWPFVDVFLYLLGSDILILLGTVERVYYYNFVCTGKGKGREGKSRPTQHSTKVSVK
jgi:hypothetical protein